MHFYLRQALAAAKEIVQQADRVVFMMCGVAGSGKTTFAKHLVALGCERFSIDEEIWHTYGRYGHDYSPDQYAEFQIAAETRLKRRLELLLVRGGRAVLDFSFWSAESRKEYKSLIESSGHLCQLVYMRTATALLRDRLRQRNLLQDANAAFPVSDHLLKQFIDGFDVPDDGGMWVVIGDNPAG